MWHFTETKMAIYLIASIASISVNIVGFLFREVFFHFKSSVMNSLYYCPLQNCNIFNFKDTTITLTALYGSGGKGERPSIFNILTHLLLATPLSSTTYQFHSYFHCFCFVHLTQFLGMFCHGMQPFYVLLCSWLQIIATSNSSILIS